MRNADTPPEKAKRPGAGNRTLLALVALGMLARLLIAAVSWGTNDAYTFNRFGAEVHLHGLAAAYRMDGDLNHPPIPIYWVLAVFNATLSHPIAFSFIMKLPSIAADAATAWLIWKILLPRVGSRQALLTSVAWAWCLDAVLVSGYHCNTDPVYTFFILLCLYLLQDRARPFAAGLALAAAINVKLTPVLLIPPLLLSLDRSRGGIKAALRFLAALGLGVIPFLPVLIPRDLRGHFRENALRYNSFLDMWGINFFFIPGGDNPLPASGPAHDFLWLYYFHARRIILGLVSFWAVTARLLGRWSLYEVAAITLALFLVFTAGFGVQYTVMIVPLLLVIRPRLGNLYGAAAGLFLLVDYFMNWKGEFPLYSEVHSFFPWPSPWLGIAAWGILVWFLVAALFRPAKTGAASPLAVSQSPRREATNPSGPPFASPAKPG